MRFIPPPRRSRRLVATALALSALIAAPAQEAGTIANPYDCALRPTLAQSFAFVGRTSTMSGP